MKGFQEGRDPRDPRGSGRGHQSDADSRSNGADSQTEHFDVSLFAAQRLTTSSFAAVSYPTAVAVLLMFAARRSGTVSYISSHEVVTLAMWV